MFISALTKGGVECPLRGKYQVTSGERNCAGRLISGCNRPQQMNIRCGPKQSSNTCKYYCNSFVNVFTIETFSWLTLHFFLFQWTSHWNVCQRGDNQRKL